MQAGKLSRWFGVLACLCGCAASPARAGVTEAQLRALELPEGLEISLFAEVPNARELVVSPDGKTVWVSTRHDRIYAVADEDQDGVGDDVSILMAGLNVPHGIALDPDSGDLFIAEQHRITRLSDPGRARRQPRELRVVWDGLPNKRWHGWRPAAFGPDGRLHVGIGVPCNICEVEGYEGSIVSLEQDGSNLEVVARGLRNSVGFDWHPVSGELYFTDNGGDRMGDHVPTEEVNRVTENGQHFGYPYIWGSEGRPYPGFENDLPDVVPVAPVLEMTAHAAPLGIHFYRGAMLPYEKGITAFIALHGSWNRDPNDPSGYQVLRVGFDPDGTVTGKEVFIEGWLDEDKKAWGRPVQFAELPDGSLLLSDDHAGVIYRISTVEK